MVIRESMTAKANCSCVGFLNPPDNPQVIGHAKISIRTVKTRSTGRSTASVCSADLAVEHRDECGGESSFSEQRPEHVRQPEGHEERVRREARADVARL